MLISIFLKKWGHLTRHGIMTRSHRKSRLAAFRAENIFRKSHRRNFGCWSRCLELVCAKTCSRDNFTPIGHGRVKLCPSVFSETITRLVNLSFSEGIFPAKFKVAAVTPLLKKPSLDLDNPSSYRPISNLNNISKNSWTTFLISALSTYHIVSKFQPPSICLPSSSFYWNVQWYFQLCLP